MNVEIRKGEFKELEFYNIYSLLSETDLEKISLQLELAVKDYRLTSEKLIKVVVAKFALILT